MGAYHGVRAAVHLLYNPCKYETRPDKSDVTKGVGELLTSVGMFTAAAGQGPIALPILGLGLLLKTGQSLAE
jgi:hypothetical protein